MTTQQDQSPASSKCPNGHRGHGRRIVGVLAIALAAGMAGGFTSKAFAHGGSGMMFGGPGMMFGGGGFRHGLTDPAQIDARIDRMMKHFAVEVEATPEQTQSLAAIAKQAARDVAPLHQKGADLRKQGATLFGATTVDRAAIERLRTEQLRLADEVSKRMTQAFADAADVLTPVQRQKLTERMQKFSERRGGHRGWHRGA